jgi:hypothetical protein
MTGFRATHGDRTRGGRVAAFCGAFVLTVAWLITLSPAARAACPVTDLECIVEDVGDGVTDDVQEVVDDVVDPVADDVEETVDPVVDDVEEVVPVLEDVEDVVDDVVDDVEEIVEDTTGVDVDPPTVGGDDPAEGGGSVVDSGPAPTEPVEPGTPRGPEDPEAPGDPGVADDPAGGSKTDGSSAGDDPGGEILTTAASVGGTVIDAESAAARLAIKAPAFFDRIGGIAGIATVLAFPLVLALVVGTFVLVQNRIDRRDPRLALAPVRPDDLRFE